MKIFKRLPHWAATTAVAMFVVTVGATAASALSCNDCVDGTDLKVDSVRSRHILNGSITSGDLKDGSVAAADVQDGAITGADIAEGTITGNHIADGVINGIHIDDGSISGLDVADASIGFADLGLGAQVRAGSVVLTDNTSIPAGSTEAFDSFTVTVPVDGQLLLEAHGAIWLDVDSASTSALVGDGTVALCTAAAVVLSDTRGSASVRLYEQDADNTNSLNSTEAFSLTRLVEVTAGTHTFYLNGRANTGAVGLFGGITTNGATVTAMLIPGSLTMAS